METITIEGDLTAEEKAETMAVMMLNFRDETERQQRSEMEEALSLTESILTRVQDLPSSGFSNWGRERWMNHKADLEQRYQKAVSTLESQGPMSERTIDDIRSAFHMADDLHRSYLRTGEY
ncbi:MAG: hypothetical protein CMH64_01860 [Nanoarchaeota archaeon]|nr:hypothetical protein [Nanoarchaeota archaeon]